MLNTTRHRLLMFQIIKDIFTSDIGTYLALKGGTACYFLYGLDRFSTDLDFDLLEDVDIDERLISILNQYGSIKNGQKIIVSYGDKDINIKIDVTRRIWKSNKYEIIDFYGTTIRVQDKATIFANKLVALTERSTNRDIYDVYFFFQQLFDINEQLILERTGGSLRDLYLQIMTKLQKLSPQYKILDGLGEVLDPAQKKRVANNLIKELQGLMTMKIKFES